MFFKKVYEACKLIPCGKVATYGQLATLAGNPRASRQVGWALHQNPEPLVIPCHRVVNRFGYLSGAFAFGGMEEQKRRLEMEGVVVSQDNTVDLAMYRWSMDDVKGGSV